MKFLMSLFFLGLGGILYFLLNTPEEQPPVEEIVQEREIYTQRVITADMPRPVEIKKPKSIPKEKKQINGSKAEKEIQMDLKEAVNNQLFGGLLTGTQAFGSIVVFENQIQSLSITLSPFGKPQIYFQIEGVPLEAGGSFVYEGDDEIISGILTPSDEKKYILRFATGPLMGSTLLFEVVQSYEEKIKLEDEQFEVQEMNQQPESSYSEMNNEAPSYEEMPVVEAELNTEMEVVDYAPEYSEMDMQESTDNRSAGFNF